MKILVTGAGGFLGYHLAKRLVEMGHTVSHFSRSSYQKLIDLNIKEYRGDLFDLDSLRPALKDQDVIFHCAALPLMWGRYEWFYNTNYVGTRNLLKLAKEYNVKKFIYTSSPSVVFGKSAIELGDESLPYPKKTLSYYAKTKAMAEDLVLKSNNVKDNFLTVAIRPHLIWGPNDPHLLPTVIERARLKKLKIVGSGNNLVDITFIENAVDAHILAMEKLERGSNLCGKSYFIGDEKPVKLWDFINSILEIHQVERIEKKIPLKVAYGVGFIFEKAYKILRIEKKLPPMTRFLSLQLGKSHYFSKDQAKNDFGYIPKYSLEKSLDIYQKSSRNLGDQRGTFSEL